MQSMVGPYLVQENLGKRNDSSTETELFLWSALGPVDMKVNEKHFKF